ncbi:MAG: 30S ribosomal protein S21 [Saprospiraceae bacterium]|nr:30S ribosomal protein S21 [Saprospiraceae bacterium]
MLIIEVKTNEPIDKALRRYKRKVSQTKIMRQVRSRKHFTKPSVVRRNERLKAAYKEQRIRDIEG